MKDLFASQSVENCQLDDMKLVVKGAGNHLEPGSSLFV
jgi:hypothetical protein